MLPRNRWFVAAALCYALLGGLLGLAWLANPGLALRAHAHLMLVGFVGMMIFGIGLADPAQTMAGRVVSATFRKPGTQRRAGRHLGTLESGKWVGGIPAPFDGTIERVNPRVEQDPGLVNIAPYSDAWLMVLRPDDLQAAHARLARGCKYLNEYVVIPV